MTEQRTPRTEAGPLTADWLAVLRLTLRPTDGPVAAELACRLIDTIDAATDEVARLRLLLDAMGTEQGEEYGAGYAAGVAARPDRETLLGPRLPSEADR